jgi:hypothetical protein
MITRSVRSRFNALPLGLALCVAATAQSPPQNFSGDIVRRDSNGAVIGSVARLRVSEFKTRIDMPEVSGGFFVTDAIAGTALFVRPAQRIFMDARQSTPLTRIFVRVDPDNPCKQWVAAALIAAIRASDDWRCEAVSTATVINPVLRFPIKWRTPDGGTVVLENVRSEAQPAELFAVPAEFRKLDPQALIERIKHSDVWAPPADLAR